MDHDTHTGFQRTAVREKISVSFPEFRPPFDRGWPVVGGGSEGKGPLSPVGVDENSLGPPEQITAAPMDVQAPADGHAPPPNP